MQSLQESSAHDHTAGVLLPVPVPVPLLRQVHFCRDDGSNEESGTGDYIAIFI